MHNQNNGSIVFNFVFRLLRKKKVSMCLWPFIVTSLRNEVVHVLAKPGGRRHPLSPPPPRAVENLSTSLFVKEYFAQV